jgi:putative membrane protein
VLKRLVLNWAILAIAVGIAAWLVPDIHVDGGFWGLLWVALLFGLVNAFLGPILHLLALPFTIITFGLFALVVNAGLLAITAGISSHLGVGGFWSAVLGALVISVVSTILQFLTAPATVDA